MENQPTESQNSDTQNQEAPKPTPASPAHSHKKRWFTPKKIAIIVGVIVILIVLGGATSNQKKNSSTSKDTGQTAPQADIKPIGQAPIQSKAPASDKSYFNTVWTHLDTVSKLSQKMNQSCSAPFPAPEPCPSDIKTYQQELFATSVDLLKVSAPASFSKADETLRNALATDIEATNEALKALQTKNWAQWFSALSKHAQAGQKLNQAGAEALQVFQ